MRMILFGLVLVAISVSGCGVTASLETYPIDERTQSTSMKRMPLKCYFVSCDDLTNK